MGRNVLPQHFLMNRHFSRPHTDGCSESEGRHHLLSLACRSSHIVACNPRTLAHIATSAGRTADRISHRCPLIAGTFCNVFQRGRLQLKVSDHCGDHAIPRVSEWQNNCKRALQRRTGRESLQAISRFANQMQHGRQCLRPSVRIGGRKQVALEHEVTFPGSGETFISGCLKLRNRLLRSELDNRGSNQSETYFQKSSKVRNPGKNIDTTGKNPILIAWGNTPPCLLFLFI